MDSQEGVRYRQLLDDRLGNLIGKVLVMPQLATVLQKCRAATRTGVPVFLWLLSASWLFFIPIPVVQMAEISEYSANFASFLLNCFIYGTPYLVHILYSARYRASYGMRLERIYWATHGGDRCSALVAVVRAASSPVLLLLSPLSALLTIAKKGGGAFF